MRPAAAQDRRQVGPAAEDPEPPHEAILPGDVSCPRTRCAEKAGKDLGFVDLGQETSLTVGDEESSLRCVLLPGAAEGWLSQHGFFEECYGDVGV